MAVFMKRDRFPMIKRIYEELPYIESTGTQYINTLFTPNQNTRIKMVAQLLSTDSSVALFGSRKSPTANNVGVCYASTTDQLVADYSSNSVRYKFTTVSPTEKLNIDFNKNTLTINSETYVFPTANFICPGNLFLFAMNQNNEVSLKSSLRVWETYVYDNDVLIRRYKPVRMKESGEIGFWDKKEERFYSNAGTGVFIAGGES